MALTLAESAKMGTDMVRAGVIETIIKEEHGLNALPFIEVVGNNFVYNRLNTEPTISFFNVGDTWSESTPDFTQVSVALKILGGDADVDNFIRASRHNVQDIEAAVIQQKAKALARKWADTFINGDVSVDAKSFDGIDKICAGLPASQTISMGVNGATLTLAKLDELIDAVKTTSRISARFCCDHESGHSGHGFLLESPCSVQRLPTWPRRGLLVASRSVGRHCFAADATATPDVQPSAAVTGGSARLG